MLQAVHGWSSTYERLVKSQKFFSSYLTQEDFSRIGRKHARIEKNGNGYCIIDLGSANHTLINNQVLIPNQPYPLPDGGEVTFTTSKPVKYRIHL